MLKRRNTMQENRNTGLGSRDGRGTVCIDTNVVLDCCKDRDCFEDARVYLCEDGEQMLVNGTNIRTKSAKILWAFVGVEEVPFNNGFYRVSVRYYIEVGFEGCVGVGRSKSFKGLVVLTKDVVLYGGCGRAISFSSDPENNFCSIGNADNMSTNDPIAVVETVEPIVLGSKVVDCGCPCSASVCCDCTEMPDVVRNAFGGSFNTSDEGHQLFVSLGIFSVIRVERPTQLLVQATDYSVPDKECPSAQNNENPCSMFRNMAFPTSEFRGTCCSVNNDLPERGNGGGCGCGNK